MATFVLVHGAWSGGFQWREVATILCSKGHNVYTPTLTGLGERSHLAHPDIGLDTHIQDIEHILFFEGLENVILAGHSYAGMVISGVAEKMPERLAHLVYMDAFIPRDGESAWKIVTEALPSATMAAIAQAVDDEGNGLFWPPPLKRSDGRDFPEGRPQPIKTIKQPLRMSNPKAAALPRAFIYCAANPESYPFRPATAMLAERAKADGMRYYELPTSHALFETMPNEVAAILMETSAL